VIPELHADRLAKINSFLTPPLVIGICNLDHSKFGRPVKLLRSPVELSCFSSKLGYLYWL